MKWTNEQVERLKEMCYAGTGNTELAKHFAVPATEIHAKRSALGITIDKCKAGRPSKQQTESDILDEIRKVCKARLEAKKKIERCDARIAELEKELEEQK